jgi:hypothetical protein
MSAPGGKAGRMPQGRNGFCLMTASIIGVHLANTPRKLAVEIKERPAGKPPGSVDHELCD